MSEYDSEPVPGLPQRLPDGETLIWQGSPDWNGVAWRVLHVNTIAVYFLLLAAAPVAVALWQGANVSDSMAPAARVVAAGALALAILAGLAKLIARTTIYSITNKRVVMRYGVALPITVNIPFNEISAVNVKDYADATADIALSTSGPLRLAYLNLWPHARGWRFEQAEPTLRSVPDGGRIAALLATTMVGAGVPGAAVVPFLRPAGESRPSLDHDISTAVA
ncbi:MAG: photosynthetic complex putative assembly protein PuhB [Hyphomicrobium sp.]